MNEFSMGVKRKIGIRVKMRGEKKPCSGLVVNGKGQGQAYLGMGKMNLCFD